MQIADLRQMTSRSLEALFDEEVRQWQEELHWDYRPSVDLIAKFIDARSLAGYVALEDRKPCGYGFYVLEDRKGLIGDLYASPRCSQAEVSAQLLREMLAAIRGMPRIERVEAQLMPFGVALDAALTAHQFRLHGRQFMYLPLEEARLGNAALSAGLRMERWSDRAFDPCARLMLLAYGNHVDGEINDQYRTESGAARFLRNIIILPGCGEFLPEASFVIRPATGDPPVGMVLTSRVASGVGHTTQVCVMPGYQGHGIGRYLMESSLRALRERKFHALSLTVTSVNATAVQLYERLGFRTIKTFAAGVWKETR
ncbi:MAG: GNAT family N-acetyltransferase [Candidatus Acidiferrales bacterium]